MTDHYGCGEEDSSASIAFKILESVAAAFPNVKMRYWMTWEGPLVQEAISVNGELVEIEPWTFVVHVPASDAYQQLLDNLNTRDLLLNLWPNRCSIGWRYDKNTDTQQAELLAEEVSKQMGNTELLLYCYLDGCPDLYLEEYAHARNGCIEWVHTDQERLALMEIPYLPISIENDVEAIEGDHFTMEDILIRPDVVFENCLTKARVGTPYYQDYLISLLAEMKTLSVFCSLLMSDGCIKGCWNRKKKPTNERPNRMIFRFKEASTCSPSTCLVFTNYLLLRLLLNSSLCGG